MSDYLPKQCGETLRDHKPIGWDGRTLKEMIEESERLFSETGCYWGLRTLPLKTNEPIRYEKIFAKLRGGLVNARETAMNISASPIVSEIGELCFAFYTPEGDSVALSTGIIVHVHTMSDAIKFMVRNDYEFNPRIRPGDIFSNNIPKIGDVHNSDVQTFVPIFWEDELVGWAGGVTHVTDIGASTPGNVPVGPISSYEDGLDLTANKIGENDVVFRDHEIRCEQGVRTPMFWKLDERTRIAGCHMIRDAVERIIREEGIDTFKQFIREAIEEGRRTFIQRIKETTVPGRYFCPTFVDLLFKGERGLPDYAAIDTLSHAPLELTIGPGGEFHISFDGASKWGYHSFNCPPSAMQGAIWVLLTQTVIPNDKVNDGAYLATSHEFPPFTLANPVVKEAATGAAWGFLIPAFTGLVRALSRAFYARGYVEEVLSSYGMTMNAMQGGGKDQYGRDTGILNFEVSCQGVGARAIADGADYCAAMWNPEGNMGDVEVWELLIPFIYLGRCVKPNSAGLGKYRGGSGYASLYAVWKTPDLVMQNCGDGSVFPSPGIFGGYPSASGYRHNVLNTDLLQRFASRLPYPSREDDPADSEISRLVEGEHLFDCRTLNYPYRMNHGDIYYSIYRGGGGLGDPLERDPALIEDDLNGDFVLPRYAEKVYGAKVSRDGSGLWRVDASATEKRRQELREERARRAVPVRDWLAMERERVLSGKMVKEVRVMYNQSMDLSTRWGKWFREFWKLPDDFRFSEAEDEG
jgi:N-methylhydantoinase B/oxoprolinase/acetone carboxylase alpha subunit